MQIYILRHGIAEVAQAGMSDADRALVPEGKKKLRSVLRVVRNAGVAPKLILTSPLLRAVETAEIAAAVLGYEDKIVETEVLRPGHSPNEVWDEIRTHSWAEQILLSGHEPQLGYATGYLLGAPSLAIDLKKGAVVRVDVDQFGAQPRGVLRWHLTPKLVVDRR